MHGLSIVWRGTVTAALLLASIAATASADAAPTLVRDLNPSGSSNAGELVRMGDTIYLAAGDGVHGRELWKSDGTRAGTRMVSDIRPGRNGSQPRDLVNVRGTLFFTADDGVHGRELWASDGTRAGTRMIRNLSMGSTSSTLGSFTAVGGRLFFVRIRSCGDFCARPSVWVSDGTSAGTKKVHDASDTDLGWPRTAAMATTLFITDLDRLLRIDGTRTTVVKDFRDGITIDALTVVGDRLFLVHGRGLWVTDGSQAGTRRLHRFPAGTRPAQLNRFGTRLAFLAGDRSRELWISDGTADGTRFVDTLEPTYEPEYGGMAVVSGTLFVSTGYEVGTPRLWKSDGTPGSTVVVTTFSGGEPAQELTRVGGVLCFVGFDGTSWELWSSDGTEAGTVAVSAFHHGHRAPYWLTPLDGAVVFGAADKSHGYELWSYRPD
jgi:ELWxxDGT repeat protein